MKTALQLYSIRDGLMQNLSSYLKSIKSYGYDGAEIYDLGQENVLTIIDEMKKAELEVFSILISLEELISCDEKQIIAYAQAGCKYISICWVPFDYTAGEKHYDVLLQAIKKFSELAKKHGLRLLYHNHDFELDRIDNTTKLDKLYSDISSDTLGAEFDSCWIYFTGNDVNEYLDKYCGRCPILHLKDCIKNGEHRPEFRAVGDGRIDFVSIIEKAKSTGVEWLCVEQDEPTSGKTPLLCAKESIDYLKGVI